jgi:hypothetical protein
MLLQLATLDMAQENVGAWQYSPHFPPEDKRGTDCGKTE